MTRKREILQRRVRSIMGPTRTSTPMIKVKEKKPLDKGQYQDGVETYRGYGTYV